MCKVITTFRDKYSKVIYNPGDTFNSDQESRVQDLISRGFITPVEQEQPAQPEQPEQLESAEQAPAKKKNAKRAAE